MHIVILAAGQSKRFQEEGYTRPKPFLNIEWRGTKDLMVNHVIKTIPYEWPRQTLVAISSVSVLPQRPDFHHKVVEVGKTKGPAHTLWKVLHKRKPEHYLILDVDILNFTNDLSNLVRHCTHTYYEEGGYCGVLISKSANPGFSYVGRDINGEFDHIEEKQRISDYAVRGAYFVPRQRSEEFLNNLENTIAEKSEPYISHAFNLMADKKTTLITTYEPIDWGTPRDVKLSGARIITPREE